jgi:peptidoglycan-N-acetylglucosamine deacetylase
MRIALTLDDLPVYPHLSLAPGHTPASVAERVLEALARNEVGGVFAFSNSWPLDVDHATAGIFDAWVAQGHHIGNHTHSHPLLNDTSAEDFIDDVCVADELLMPWMRTAPHKTFRYPLDLWGNTEEKRSAVRAHLDATGYTCAEVTSWFFEWEWDRAWQVLRQKGETAEAEALKDQFVDYCIAQLAYARTCCQGYFDRDIIGVGLIHTVGFIAEVADRLLARMRAEGVEFVPLGEALTDPAYARVASIVSDRFLVYQQKLAAAEGKEMASVAPAQADLMKRIFELATPLRPARRGQLVQNHRKRSA